MDQPELQDKIGTLGRALREQFNLLATGNLDDVEQSARLVALSEAARTLHNELAAEFGIADGPPVEVLEKILTAAKSRGVTGMDDLKIALAQLQQMKAELPENACPMVDAVQEAARNAMNMDSQKQAAACGTWVSPLTAELVTGKTVTLGAPAADGGTLYWLESRPAEQGRSALVRRTADGTISDVTPAPVNVASRVHEYGGGAYAVSSGRIVYTEKTDGSVWLIDHDAAPRQIAAVKDCRYADFRFIPGTDNIVCVREDHRNRPQTNPEAAIVMLDASANADPAKNDGIALVKGPDFLSSPRISPDGSKLAWLSWNHPDMPWDATQLHVADFTRGSIANEKIVAGDRQREAIVQPEWSPDGTLYFSSDRSDWWNIYRLNNGAVVAVTKVPDGEIGGPAWQFGSRYFGFMSDGNIIAALSRNGQTHAVTVDSRDGKVADLGLPLVGACPAILPGSGGTTQLAWVSAAGDSLPVIGISSAAPGATSAIIRQSGPVLTGTDYVSTGEEITFPTAHGENAHAFYYPPVNGAYKPLAGEKPPLVVMIHGGPTAAAGTAYSASVQWWTTRGFAVADINYRGSTGYGRPYRQELNGNWGIADVEDCVAAVKFLTDAGKIDPDRAAIRGGSAGGFTVLAALTNSNVFKAGASHYGVGDLMLLAGETHKFESRYLDRLIGPLPEAEAIYRERSPINHLDRVKAATIFFQGLDDKIVPPSQAATMVDAMKALHLPVAHYEFAGEAHGFRKAETLKRVLNLELGFYGRIFGFDPPGLSEEPEIAGLDDKPEVQTPPAPNAP